MWPRHSCLGCCRRQECLRHTRSSAPALLLALRGVTIAAVALPRLRRRRRLAAVVLRQRAVQVVRFTEAAVRIAADVPLVAAMRLDQFALSRHAVLLFTAVMNC